jgi:uncharacterized RDD family membrane protein YckC
MPCRNHPLVEEPLVRCARCGEAFCPDCVVVLRGLPYCARCKVETLADLRAGVPAGQLDLASIGARFVALFVDGLVLVVPVVTVTLLITVPMGLFDLGRVQPVGPAFGCAFQGVYTFLAIGANVLYEGLMLGARGQTVGKRAMHIKVVTPEGHDLRRGQAWGRAAARSLFGLVPCFGIVDYLMAFFNPDRACLHDQIAKTRVVRWHG